MRAKEKIYNKLVSKLGVKHPDVWKGYSRDTLATGWHCREFGRSNTRFMGTSLKEALETIEDWRIEKIVFEAVYGSQDWRCGK